MLQLLHYLHLQLISFSDLIVKYFQNLTQNINLMNLLKKTEKC